jgi:mycothiol synthase
MSGGPRRRLIGALANQSGPVGGRSTNSPPTVVPSALASGEVRSTPPKATPEIEVKKHLSDEELTAIVRLLDAASAADHHHPLGEHKWLDLVQGGRRGFVALLARLPGHDHVVGYAQLSRNGPSWALELVVHPHHRSPPDPVHADLLQAALDCVRQAGGGHLHLWVPKPTPTDDLLASKVGLRRGRDLFQMRRPLPAAAPPPLAVRPFRVGEDEEAWLSVNNRAFAWHPEQGAWDAATLAARETEPWFDPDGFLLHEVDGKIAGFCWTKVHTDEHPPLGEIYVIAVDPAWQGRGLGRALVLTGLDHLSRAGLTVGMLYVDAQNAPALALYRNLGFEIDHVDRAYVGDLEPTRPGPATGSPAGSHSVDSDRAS